MRIVFDKNYYRFLSEIFSFLTYVRSFSHFYTCDESVEYQMFGNKERVLHSDGSVDSGWVYKRLAYNLWFSWVSTSREGPWQGEEMPQIPSSLFSTQLNSLRGLSTSETQLFFRIISLSFASSLEIILSSVPSSLHSPWQYSCIS